MVMKCQYSVGEEGHRKFWCRGPHWKDCVRAIETTQVAGQEVRRGRVTLRDSPREHFFVVTMQHLEEGDADTYWCGVDRARGVPQAPLAVTIFPGSAAVAMRTTETSAGTGTLALTSHMSGPGLPACFYHGATWLAWLQRHPEGYGQPGPGNLQLLPRRLSVW
ncbi:hypothetical protein HPG69_006056 [Diceros bicornis minor]|uniref:Immunoglobulin V-set domain-containing protein n=1 Tax=Diceros bicornis minor TaxID=77932 RepID=A0A7J7EVK3_DICBM|nr:hypothetical protein HPG69_006056 [Diceros bicornis minor]